MNEGTPILVPLGLLITLIGPLYALIAGLYVLLFRHSMDKDKHNMNMDLCKEVRQKNAQEHIALQAYIRDVEVRFEKQSDRIFREIESLQSKMDRLIEKLL